VIFFIFQGYVCAPRNVALIGIGDLSFSCLITRNIFNSPSTIIHNHS
jgi:hypothetical protein